MKYNSRAQGSRDNVSIMLGCPPSSGRFPTTRCRVCNIPVDNVRTGPCKEHKDRRWKE